MSSKSLGTSGSHKLSTTARAASHVHPFDAELMEEGKELDFMKAVNEDSQEAVSHTSLVSSTNVPRRVYVVKTTTSPEKIRNI